MKPIPLKHDGWTYAYACGRCRHVWSSSSMGHVERPSPEPQLVASSLRDAERCCLCFECGKPAGDQFTCEVCHWFVQWLSVWYELGEAISRGFNSQEEFNEWAYGDGDDAGLRAALGDS